MSIVHDKVPVPDRYCPAALLNHTIVEQALRHFVFYGRYQITPENMLHTALDEATVESGCKKATRHSVSPNLPDGQ
jgi:hypothetical protein